MSAAQLSAWASDVATEVDRFNDAARDAATAFADFTDDAAILDPSNGDYRITPRTEVVRRWSGFVQDSPGYAARTTARYLALDATADRTEVAGAPDEMAAVLPGRVLRELRVLRFADAMTPTPTTLELWYLLSDIEALNPDSCLARGTCGVDPRALAGRYLKAWSHDRAAVRELYRDDATLTDSLLGIEASGVDAIAALGTGRFGGDGAPVCTAGDIFVQTNDGDPAASDNTDPDGGKVVGVAVAYRCQSSTGGQAVDSVSILMLGTRPVEDAPVRLDPDGRIVAEEVLHDPVSLTAAGLAR